jgi:5-methylcytosine-specific restriction endonuclease McrBC GTP-binding regulatory subunit McrB
VLVIDEINRANLSAVLGELIYALEYRGRAVDSMYAVKKKDDSDIETENRQLVLPKNLYIIGTMNTADRSAGNLDYAIRRRFAFIDVLPESLLDKGFDHVLFEKVRALFSIDDEYRERSNHLAEEFRPRDVALGHSYFIGLKEDPEDPARRKFTIEYEIKPILLEYVKDGVLKESAREIIAELK